MAMRRALEMRSSPSFWTVDSITPGELISSETMNYSFVRMVHGVPTGPGGTFNLWVSNEGIEPVSVDPFEDKDSKKIDFGRSFSLCRGLYRGQVSRFQSGFPGRAPVLEVGDLGGALVRLPEIEQNIRNGIREILNETPILGGEGGGEVPPPPPPYEALPEGGAAPALPALEIFTMNVGQGDTILLHMPDNQLWLIDAYFWRRDSFDRLRNVMDTRFPGRTINRVILTHWHYDHIQGTFRLLNDYPDIQEFVVADDYDHPSPTAQSVLDELSNRGMLRRLLGPLREQSGQFSTCLMRTADYPNIRRFRKDPNEVAISLSAVSNQSLALFAADIPGEFLENLVTDGSFPNGNRECRFYKVSHHCSRTGDNATFFQTFNPSAAVTSYGRGNTHKHPHNPPKVTIDNMTNGNHRLTPNSGNFIYDALN